MVVLSMTKGAGMDNFWSLEEERQKLVNELHLGSPGEDEYEATLKSLKVVDELIPEKPDNKIHWNRLIESILPVVAGVGLTAVLEAFGLIFTSRSTFFWKK